MIMLYGVGIGPGDPELVTIKAIRRLKESDVIIFPGKDRENCRAYHTVRDAFARMELQLSNDKLVFYAFPMNMKQPMLSEYHKSVADDILKMLNGGKVVSFVTIGDPAVYSTYEYIAALVEERGYNTERINGIPSFVAAAARLGISLSLDKEEIHIIPGTENLDDALALQGTKVFMKAGKSLHILKERLIEREKIESIKVYGVTNCGLADEYLAYSAENLRDEGYLTVVIVK